MSQGSDDKRDDPAVGDELNRLSEELERRNAALEKTLGDLEDNRAALLRLLEALERERARIEQARREWTTALDAVQDPIFIHDRDMKVVRANRAYAARAGRDIRDVIGRCYWEMFPRLDGPLAGCLRAVEEQQQSDEEIQIGGETFICRNYPIRDAVGNYLYSLHLLQDVTAQRNVEAEHRRLAKALQQAAESVVVTDAEARIHYVNPAYTQLFGYTLEEVAGQPVTILAAPGAQTLQPDEVALHVRAHGGFSGPAVRRAKDGTLIPVQLTVAAVRDAAGGIEGFIGTITDLREMKRSEQALAESEARFRLLAENASDLVVVLTPDSTLRYVSHAVHHLLGYAPDEVVGHHMSEYVHPEDMAVAQATVARCISEPDVVHAVNHRIRHMDGSWRHFETLGRNLLHEPAVSGIVLNSRDITERKRAEESLLDLNRTLKTLSACNAALVHSQSEPELLQNICRVIVETGEYPYAWIGFLDSDAHAGIRQVAQAGFEPGYLESLLSRSSAEHADGPSNIAIREGAVFVSHDASSDPVLAAWRDAIVQLGVGSVAAFPLMDGEIAFGMLSICARERNAFDRDELMLLAELAEDLNFGILSLRTRIQRDEAIAAEQRGLERLRANLEATIGAVAATVEARDPYTAGHERRVAELASAIARELDLPPDRVEGIHFGALIHDLGKIRVPAEILSKPSALTRPEFELVKEHAQAGYDILKGVQFPWPVAEMAWQHHEHVDGSGYPQGLKGDAMLLESKILAVADTVEAMSSHRPYRPALGVEAALAEITAHRGDWYDPDVVDACLRLFRENRFVFSG